MLKKGATRTRGDLVLASIPQHGSGILAGLSLVLILIKNRVAKFTTLGYLLDESHCLA